ncbi:flagellin [Bacillus sp. BK006]|nr:flagellin [Bacillus sp. BK006]
MRINHNIAALNTYRQFNNANNAQSKSMEKLSSGLRINSAADDAAGLAISEKMRGQIRGLDMASKNAQDGVSLIQTAEGALTETHDILQRMKELATQAANDTNTTDDRGEIQKEINQLTSEVNRIANTTEFNTKKVLDGGKTAAATPAGGAAGAASGVNAKADAQTVGGTNTFSFDLGTAGAKGNFDIQFTTGGAAGAAFDATGKTLTVTLDQTNSAVTADDVQALIRNATTNKPADLDLSKFTVSADGTDVIDATGPVDEKVSLTGGEDVPTTSATGTFQATLQIGANKGQGFQIDINDMSAAALGISKASSGGAAGAASGVNAKADAQTVGGTNTFSFDLGTAGAKGNFDIQFTTGGAAGAAFDATGKTLTVTLDQTNSAVTADDVQALIRNATTNKPADLDLSKFTVSADGTDVIDATGPVDEKVSLTGGEDTPTASSAGSFTTQAGVSNGTDNSSIESALDVSTHDNATNAIDVLDKAIAKVSGERSKLGAYQNRLDHTINNLNTSSENLTAAESRIRDVDYALAA